MEARSDEQNERLCRNNLASIRSIISDYCQARQDFTSSKERARSLEQRLASMRSQLASLKKPTGYVPSRRPRNKRDLVGEVVSALIAGVDGAHEAVRERQRLEAEIAAEERQLERFREQARSADVRSRMHYNQYV